MYSNESVNFTTSEPFIQLNRYHNLKERLLKFVNNSDIQNKSTRKLFRNRYYRPKWLHKTVTVNLEIINDATEFDVNPKILQ